MTLAAAPFAEQDDTSGGALVTGATGFVGSALLGRLSRLGLHRVRAAVRRPAASVPHGVELTEVADSGPHAIWGPALAGVRTVVHSAARVHAIDAGPDTLAEYQRVNAQGTLNLARQAASAGVRRFVFISSIKVNGETTRDGAPFRAEDAPAPVDPYAISKREAEDGLRHLATETGLEVVVIRPPLVYGPGVKANFLRMMTWLHKGIPLPFGAIRNKRSLVSLDNLIDLIVTCMDHTAAANQTFLVADGEDLSTTELLRRMGDALGKPARLIAVPHRLLSAGAVVFGRQDLLQRLCASLQADISKTRELLGWTPPASVEEALRATARHFLDGAARH